MPVTHSKKDAIAEAVKESLIVAGLVTRARCERKHAFEKKLEDVARIDSGERVPPLVTVCPKAESKVRGARGPWIHLYDIAITIQAYCQFTDLEWQDELSKKVEAIADHISTVREMAGATFMTMSLDALFDLDHLHDNSQYLAMPVFTYRLERST